MKFGITLIFLLTSIVILIVASPHPQRPRPPHQPGNTGKKSHKPVQPQVGNSYVPLPVAPVFEGKAPVHE